MLRFSCRPWLEILLLLTRHSFSYSSANLCPSVWDSDTKVLHLEIGVSFELLETSQAVIDHSVVIEAFNQNAGGGVW